MCVQFNAWPRVAESIQQLLLQQQQQQQQQQQLTRLSTRQRQYRDPLQALRTALVPPPQVARVSGVHLPCDYCPLHWRCRRAQPRPCCVTHSPALQSSASSVPLCGHRRNHAATDARILLQLARERPCRATDTVALTTAKVHATTDATSCTMGAVIGFPKTCRKVIMKLIMFECASVSITADWRGNPLASDGITRPIQP